LPSALRNVFRRDENIAATNAPSARPRPAIASALSRRLSRTSADSTLGAGQNAFAGNTRKISTSAKSCAITDNGP
jgi:hypothetical protein